MQGDRQRAMSLAAEARTLAADLAAPAAHHARLLLADGRAGRAAKAVERAWRTAPHPALAQAYGEIWSGRNPARPGRAFRAPRRPQPLGARKSCGAGRGGAGGRAMGRGAAPSRTRAGGRSAACPPPAIPADRAGSPPPTAPAADRRGRLLARATPQLCLMMARVEEAEHGDLVHMREWLDRAARAMPDPALCLRELRGRDPGVAVPLSPLRRLRRARLANPGLGGPARGFAGPPRSPADSRPPSARPWAADRQSRGRLTRATAEALGARAGTRYQCPRRPGSSAVEQPLRKR